MGEEGHKLGQYLGILCINTPQGRYWDLPTHRIPSLIQSLAKDCLTEGM